ncbi:Hsp70 family protein, partial [Bacillus thuringiensis]|uniref:Hsp70 family protein n=1 Tax=Bacillus thuringiensis TaxID=1428 RepID=UPI0011A8B345
FSSQHLSSFLIKSLKQHPQPYLNQHVTPPLITLPPYFNHTHTNSTKPPPQIPPLTLQPLITQPTPPPIPYPLYQQQSQTKFLLFHLP